MVILEVKKLSKSFGKLDALRDVSFEVEEGELFGLAGPNGSGKTTLLNAIAGLLHGLGEVIFQGENINGLRPNEICNRGIARGFQIPLIFSTLTVYENVLVGAHFSGRAKHDNSEGKSVDEAINLVGLQGKRDILAGDLAIFDRKMTMLAAALATKPKLLLLDEPLGGLSPTEVAQSVGLIRKINEELGLTIIIIEHLMRELSRLCHRLMILNFGEKICIGHPTEVTKDRKVIEIYLGARYARGG